MLRDFAVAVVVVHAEREEQLVVVRPEDELSHALHELGSVDRTVVIAIEGREHAPREVLAAEAERLPKLGEIDASVGAGVVRESSLEHREQAAVGVVRAVHGEIAWSTPRKRSHGKAWLPSRAKAPP